MILNRQDRVSIQIPGLSRFWRRVRKELKLDPRDATVCFVSDVEIARLNHTYRAKRKATDVLSFPFGDGGNRRSNNAEGRRYLGDIAIAPGVARRNAMRLGRTVDEELRILMLHGALHLLGYDHEADDGEMDRVEARLRRRLGLR
ncbi:MAG TPA: rRNA maturation RNase YbeY [Candidatus Acidoferrales bacterium]|nr:rRNA maturation RNase YbeY [Candidatus Acidoferrales bacterium]